MARLHSLSVSGYKSIKNIEKLELKNLNILIGANGAGKSNFISLFRLLNAIENQQLQLYVQKQGGPDSLLHFGRKNTEKMHFECFFTERLMNGYKFDLIPQLKKFTNNKLFYFSKYLVFCFSLKLY